jgi:isopentenyl-diphosphate delta-isomerase
MILFQAFDNISSKSHFNTYIMGFLFGGQTMVKKHLSPHLLARQVILVDEADQQIGLASLVSAHQNQGLLHRAASAYLFRRKNGRLEFLIQQRSQEKILAAGLWANTVCGNVAPRENYRQCIDRRLKEELGIERVELVELTKYRYQVDCGGDFAENEIDQIFVGWYDGPTQLNPEEVTQVSWVDWRRFLDFIQKVVTEPAEPHDEIIFHLTNFAPWMELMFNEPQILVPLKKFLNPL